MMQGPEQRCVAWLKDQIEGYARDMMVEDDIGTGMYGIYGVSKYELLGGRAG